MLRFAFAVVAAGAVAIGAVAYAQDTTGPSDSARYTFYRVQDYFLRLDVQTGRVSECNWARAGWTCRVVPDERATLESEIARLTASNLALKKELLAHGLSLPEGIKPDPPLDKNIVGETKLPPVEFNRVTSYVGNVWRRVVGMMAQISNFPADILHVSQIPANDIGVPLMNKISKGGLAFWPGTTLHS